MSRHTPSFRLLVPALLVAAAVFASAAAAEMPSNRDAPTITGAGGPVVGQTLVGNNGTWLYADGSACRAECNYAFAWYRCDAGGRCAPIPGAVQRTYRVAPADVGSGLRVVVTATKHDCNAIGQDCRLVSRTAPSPQTEAVVAPTPPLVRLHVARVGVERARRGLVVAVGVTDASGRPVRSVRVRVGRFSGLTGVNGTARIRVPVSSLALRVRAEKPGAEAASLDLRLPSVR